MDMDERTDEYMAEFVTNKAEMDPDRGGYKYSIGEKPDVSMMY